MPDSKSKLPDLNEITSMAGKLFKDVKTSITEIIADYKANHPADSAAEPEKPAKKAAEKSEPETVAKDDSSAKKTSKVETDKPEDDTKSSE